MDDDSPAPGGRPDRSPYLTNAQAAHYLGMSARSLRRLRMRGGGPVFRRHLRVIYYHVDDLHAWSAARREGGTR